MNEQIVRALAAEIEQATAAGDHDRTQKLSDLQEKLITQIGRDSAGSGSADLTKLPLPRREQLARTARRISTEALSAELAADRGDWEMVRATYERLALLFAEYRLLYMQCLGF
jgi:hypothetical protein